MNRPRWVSGVLSGSFVDHTTNGLYFCITQTTERTHSSSVRCSLVLLVKPRRNVRDAWLDMAWPETPDRVRATRPLFAKDTPATLRQEAGVSVGPVTVSGDALRRPRVPPNRADQIPVVKATREPYPCLVIVNTVHKLCGGAERVDAGKGSRRGSAGRRELGDLRRGRGDRPRGGQDAPPHGCPDDA